MKSSTLPWLALSWVLALVIGILVAWTSFPRIEQVEVVKEVVQEGPPGVPVSVRVPNPIPEKYVEAKKVYDACQADLARNQALGYPKQGKDTLLKLARAYGTYQDQDRNELLVPGKAVYLQIHTCDRTDAFISKEQLTEAITARLEAKGITVTDAHHPGVLIFRVGFTLAPAKQADDPAMLLAESRCWAKALVLAPDLRMAMSDITLCRHLEHRFVGASASKEAQEKLFLSAATMTGNWFGGWVEFVGKDR